MQLRTTFKLIKEKKILLALPALVLLYAIIALYSINPQLQEEFYYIDETKPKYTIYPTSAPCDTKYLSYSTYNQYTKQYFMIRSYIEKLEKSAGGTLIFKKGTYRIPVNLFISSGIHFVFEDGVYIKKTTATGSTLIRHSDNLFQMVSHANSKVAGSVGKYGGTRNVTFTALGQATIDMDYHEAGCAIIMAHNYNMGFYGITFMNANGHFFELDASKNVTIENCKFINVTGTITEAINIDTPDVNTGGFGFKWSKMDRTPNDNVLIKKCYFENMPRAIGTHKYSMTDTGLPIYHNNIRAIYNTMTQIKDISIRPLNWSTSLIAANNMSGPGKSINKYAMLAGGIKDVTIRNNHFSNYYRIIAIRPAKNGGAGSEYPPTYNYLTTGNIDALKSNTCEASTVSEYYARINKTLDLTDKATLILLITQ